MIFFVPNNTQWQKLLIMIVVLTTEDTFYCTEVLQHLLDNMLEWHPGWDKSSHNQILLSFNSSKSARTYKIIQNCHCKKILYRPLLPWGQECYSWTLDYWRRQGRQEDNFIYSLHCLILCTKKLMLCALLECLSEVWN